jgi:succinoglycan biosynthesis protein ExoA
MMKLSVHIVTAGRFHLFRSCLKSVLSALPPESEVTIVINGSFPETAGWLEKLGDLRVRWLEITSENRPKARNRAFQICRGEVIYFLDDDVTVPSDLFTRALSHFKSRRKLAVIGGPNLTPPESDFNEQLYGAIMTSSFAAPMICSRYGAGCGKTDRPGTEHDLILCNLAVRRLSIPPSIKFPALFRSNEENLFITECIRDGLEVRFDPQMHVFHKRRSSLGAFLDQIQSYGFGRAQQVTRAPLLSHPAFLVPGAVLLWCLFIPFFPVLVIPSLFFLAVHCIASGVAGYSCEEIRRTGWKGLIASIPLTGLIHICYGFGFWEGVLYCLKQALTPSLRESCRQVNQSTSGNFFG